MEHEVLGDRYEMQEPIGRGGMATIYRAIDLRMGRTVAVKILREVYSSDPKFVTRFQREARAASALQHPNIVQVFDYGQSGEHYYIVMEFIVGADLRRYLKRHGILSNERAIEIAHDVGLGLGAAHKRGIVHRDVKPQNVMLNDDGLVKLTDFGIASMYKDAGDERLTTTGMTLGTVQYYAPEQAQGEVVTPAADIYALGIVMYEMVAGKTPFDGDTPVAVAMRHIQDTPEPPSAINPRVSPAFERIILRCLEKDPRDRYRDGDTLAYALENLARSPQRKTSTLAGGTPPRQPQFAPLALPANDGRPQPGGGFGAYGAQAVLSGPQRGGRGSSAADGGRGSPSQYFDGPDRDTTYGGYGPEPALSTRPQGPAPGTMPRTPGTRRSSGSFGPQRPNDRRGNGALIGVIVSAAVLLLGLTCFLLLSITGLGKAISGALSPGATATATTVLTSVPDFTGLQFTVAQSQAQTQHLTLTENLQPNPTVAQGFIFAQDTKFGTQVKWGFAVTVTVSAGPAKVNMPDETNKPLADAQHDLANKGFTTFNAPQYVLNTSVTAGYVFKTNPAAGTPITPDTPITLYVATGPTPTPTNTPTATATATATATPSSPTP